MNPDFLTTARPISRLIQELNKLPGIGPKTAQRLAYHLLQAPPERSRDLADAVLGIKENLKLCTICLNITDTDPCGLCADETRDVTKVCVVEEPIDILPLERTRKFRGLYHVLHGVISPSDGIKPEDLRIRELLERLNRTGITEVILATNPNVEGEATSMYIQRLISPLGIRVTRLARGLPFGGDLEYADDVTLSRALEGRQEM
ncbi:MAG: recombination mediator RecR [Chloroflexi bacterium]|nr:recombination mediator RecR [Chloroflexota bacterium]MCX6002407.1 recombination mediator RecR [Chloroflexota bacterium]